MAILSWTESYGEDDFKGFNMTHLKRDQAYVNFIKHVEPAFFYSVYKECYEVNK